MNRSSSLKDAQANNIHRLVRLSVDRRNHTARQASGRNSSHLEFLGAALPLIIALTTFCMVLVSGPLIGASQNQMDRLIEQNQLLVGLVCLLAVAVLGLAIRNLKGSRK
jgi:hypothetical protein